jgi:hypothetical protein
VYILGYEDHWEPPKKLPAVEGLHVASSWPNLLKA